MARLCQARARIIIKSGPRETIVFEFLNFQRQEDFCQSKCSVSFYHLFHMLSLTKLVHYMYIILFYQLTVAKPQSHEIYHTVQLSIYTTNISTCKNLKSKIFYPQNYHLYIDTQHHVWDMMIGTDWLLLPGQPSSSNRHSTMAGDVHNWSGDDW